MSETRLNKTDFIPFIDVSGSSSDTASYKRVDKSTIFSMKANANTEEFDYISYETPETVIKNYAPDLEQEIAIYEGNAVYDFLFSMLYNLPTGNDCVVPFLMCFGGEDKLAWLCDATIILGELNTVDGKLTFTIKIGGDITRGTYVVTDGVPVFTDESNE